MQICLQNIKRGEILKAELKASIGDQQDRCSNNWNQRKQWKYQGSDMIIGKIRNLH